MDDEKRKITKRAGVVGFLTLVSRIAGLARDMAIASVFGTRLAADAFFVAFRIPNLLRRLFAEGALTVSFVPVFTGFLKKSHTEAKEVADITFSFMVVIVLGVTVLGVFFSPFLVRLTAWGFVKDSEKFTLTVSLTRVMFPYLVFISLAAWAMGVLNSLKHFSSPAASPIFMNLGIIIGALFLTRWFQPPALGLAMGVLLGGVLQLLTHFPSLIKFRFWPRLSWNPSHPGVKKILGMMIPAAYGAAAYQFNVMTMTFLASFLPSGSVSYLWYADRVMEFPLGIFTMSVATVILPTFSEHVADHDLRGLKESFLFGLRWILFITLPAAAGLMVLSTPIIRVLFQHGSFTESAVKATSLALFFFALSLPFLSGVRITSNAFYALQDSKTPVRIANLSVLVNILLSLLFIYRFKHTGLALALSLSSLFNFLMHLYDFRKKVGTIGFGKIYRGLAKALTATGLMVACLFGVDHWLGLAHKAGFIWEAMRLLVLMSAGVASYFFVGFILKMTEIKEFYSFLKGRQARKSPPPSFFSGQGGDAEI